MSGKDVVTFDRKLEQEERRSGVGCERSWKVPGPVDGRLLVDLGSRESQ